MATDRCRLTRREEKMKYGKRLRREIERSFPKWRGQFLAYKKLKKKLKVNSKTCPDNGRQSQSQRWSRFWDVSDARKSFSQLLGYEFDKVTSFYFDKEEDYIIRLKELQTRAVNLNSNEEKLDVQKDIIEFHAEMVLLLHYSVLNFTGFNKIVKKHNKRTGKSFQFSRMPRVYQQSFFSTDLLYKLMEDCEAMLCSLFLSEEEDNGLNNP